MTGGRDKRERDDEYEAGFAKPPHRACPKCGDPYGFDVPPRYFVPVVMLTQQAPGWLVWACRRCDYEVRTAPLDVAS